VHGLPSSQSGVVPLVHWLATHRSIPSQTSPSLQSVSLTQQCGTGALRQPTAGSQKSVVQTAPSSQSGTGQNGPSNPALQSGSRSGAQSSGAGGSAGYIQADATTNTLIITAPEAVYRSLRTVIDQLDVRRAQVYIESMIVEMDANQGLGRLTWFGIR